MIMNELESKVLLAFIQSGCNEDVAIKRVKEGDYIVYPNCNSAEEAARNYCLKNNILETIPYFDYEEYGRDMEIEGLFHKINDDYVELIY